MKKVSGIWWAFIAFLVAFVIQITTSIVFVFLILLVELVAYIKTGSKDFESKIGDRLVNTNTSMELVIAVISAVICLIIFMLWYKNITGNQSLKNVSKWTSTKKIIGIILLGFGLQISLTLALNMIASIKPQWFVGYGEVMESLGKGNTVLSVLYIAIIAPLSEEFIFRGVILKKAQTAMKFCTANLLQALLFGIYHGNLVQGIYGFVLGIFLGVVCYKMKSIYASTVLHMTINISGLLLGYIFAEDVSTSPIAILVIAAAGIAAVAYGSAVILNKEESYAEID